MTPAPRYRFLPLATCAAALLLSGCGISSETELRQWMDNLKATMKPNTEPVPDPKEFVPFAYDPQSQIDPFDPQKILMAVARQQQAHASASAIRPDLDRRREVLEGFPLDQIRMVGMMKRANANVALLETSGATHLVKVGNYVGQNFGLVTKISETEVQLKEIVQDAAGEWIERPAKLELQQGAGGSQAQGSKK